LSGWEWVWLTRRELTAAFAPFVLAGMVFRLGGALAAIGAGTLIVAVGFGWPWSRRHLLASVGAERRTRRLLAAITPLAPGAWSGRLPKVRQLRATPAGEVADVLLPAGAAMGDVSAMTERLAVTLGLHSVTTLPDPALAGPLSLHLRTRDPLTGDGLPWPPRDAERVNVWEPVPIGVDEDGRDLSLPLVGHNLLIGGEPGAGKSVALSLLVAAAALDPDTDLHLFDGKLVELAPCTPVAATTAGVDTAQAVEVLAHLDHQMDARYRALLTAGARKITPGLGWRVQVVVVEELAHYLTTGSKDTRARFTELLRDLVSRGRAAGVVVLAATQKPGSEVISTSLRDLFGFRLALRCSTPAASNTILGSGWASTGSDPPRPSESQDNEFAEAFSRSERGAVTYLLDGGHQGEGDQRHPKHSKAKLRARLRVGGDARRVVIRSPGDQSRPERA